jgi:hypothetical protein
VSRNGYAGLATAAVPRGAGLSDVLGIGDIVRVTGATRHSPAYPPGCAAEPDQVTVASTAARPVRNITVKAPTERRAIVARARACHVYLPEKPPGKISPTLPTSVVDPQSPDLRCYWPLGHTCDVSSGGRRRGRGVSTRGWNGSVVRCAGNGLLWSAACFSPCVGRAHPSVAAAQDLHIRRSKACRAERSRSL